MYGYPICPAILVHPVGTCGYTDRPSGKEVCVSVEKALGAVPP